MPASKSKRGSRPSTRSHKGSKTRTEQLARAILDQAAEAIVVCDAEGRITQASRAARTLCGEDPVGQPFAAIFPLAPEPGSPPGGILAAALRGQVLQGVGAAFKRKDGCVFNLQVSAGPLRSAANVVMGCTLTLTDMTERQRLLAELEAERNLWRAAVESMPNPVTIADAGGRAIYMNPAYSRMIAREIVPGLNLEAHPNYYQLYKPDGALFDVSELPLQRAALNGEPVSEVEIVQRSPDGAEHSAIWNASPLRDDSGKIIGAVAIGRDVTEQRRAEQALTQAEEELKKRAALIDLSPDAIIVRDLDGTIRFWSRGAEALYGWSQDQALGRRTHDLLYTRFPRAVEEIEAEVMQTGFWQGEIEHMRRDGTPVPVDSRWQLERDESGKPLSILETNTDITFRVQATEALRASEKLFRLTVDNDPGMVTIYDAQRRVRFVNAQAVQVTGRLESEQLGRTDEELWPPEVTLGYLPLLKRAVDTRMPQHGEVTLPLPHRTFIMDLTYVPVLDERGAIEQVVGIAHDVTEREQLLTRERAIRRELEETLARLQESEVQVRQLSESNIIGILRADEERITAANAAFLDMLGYSRADLEAGLLRWKDMTPLEYAAQDAEAIRQLIADGVAKPFEKEFWRKDGRRVLVLSGGARLERTPLTWVCFVLDLSERERAEAARAQALAREHAARAAAERNAERIARLQSVTAALTAALMPAQVASIVVEQGVSALHARGGGIALLDESGAALRIVHASGYPDAWIEPNSIFSLTAPVPFADVIKTAEPIWIESPDALVQKYPELAEFLGEAHPSWASLPLLTNGRAIGAMAFSFGAVRAFDEHERAFMLALAQQCTQALERARLYEAEQKARQAAETARRRFEFLSEASSLLASSLDYEETLQNVADLVVHKLADWCSVDLVTEAGTVKSVAVAHLDPAKAQWARELRQHYPPDPNAPHGVPQVLRTGAPELYSHVAEAGIEPSEITPWQLQFIRTIGATSVMIVPLTARGRTLGALTLIYAESGQHYDTDDLALAEELARRAALALDNARLYQEAQAAIRLRDQFFTVASHELKTPLTSMMGYAEMLSNLASSDAPRGEREQRAVRTIFDQTQRLNRMMTALLDVSRIETGQLSLDRAPMDLAALAQRVINDLQLGVQRHRLELRVPDAPVVVMGDELRLEQVLQNLVQNAIKYSPHGGTIHVRVEAHGDTARAAVSDEGIGIPADALPKLFARFYRARNVESWHITGMGMGLFVVKEIMTLHGGTVMVESVEGEGSTFTIQLPMNYSGNESIN
jgi:PAS domain S-box-containing protein